MFDSPMEWCRICRAWVAIDQTLGECMGERKCAQVQCPLAALLKRDEARREFLGDTPFDLR